MDARDFLTLAFDLVARPDEAAWRSAVSRAYYAAFHVARDLLRDLKFVVPHADRAHGYLWLRLANCGHPPVEQAAADYNLLRRDRNYADYDLQRAIRQPFALILVRTAEKIIRTLDAVATDPVRTQIADAIKIYERDVLKNVTWHP